MNKIIIVQPNQVMKGTVTPSGSKNMTLPILSCLPMIINCKVTIHNIPNISDVNTLIAILKHLNIKVTKLTSNQNANSYEFDTANIKNNRLPSAIKATRSPIMLLTPMLQKFKEAYLPCPGGCPIGLRPVNWHFDTLEKMGVKVNQEKNTISTSCEEIKGSDLHIPQKSVGVTETAIMAAVSANGTSTIKNFSTDPDVIEMMNFLKAAGAKIDTSNEHEIKITGTKLDSLRSFEYSILSDRIEIGSYIIAATVTSGELEIKNASFGQIDNIYPTLLEIGVNIKESGHNSIIVGPPKQKLKPFKIETEPYPGFPTDLQAMMCNLAIKCDGQSSIVEKIFEDRMQHAKELSKIFPDMIKSTKNTATINGNPDIANFKGTIVAATDLRASMSLLIAGMMAQTEETIVTGASYIERGYADIIAKMQKCGINAKIEERELN